MDVRSGIEKKIKNTIQKIVRQEMVVDAVIPLSYAHHQCWSDQPASISKIANRDLDDFDKTFLNRWLASKKRLLFVGLSIPLIFIAVFAYIFQSSSSPADEKSSERNKLMFLSLLAIPFAFLLVQFLTKYLFKLSLKNQQDVDRYLNEKTEFLYAEIGYKQILSDLIASGQTVNWNIFHQKITALPDNNSALLWRQYLRKKLVDLEIMKRTTEEDQKEQDEEMDQENSATELQGVMQSLSSARKETRLTVETDGGESDNTEDVLSSGRTPNSAARVTAFSDWASASKHGHRARSRSSLGGMTTDQLANLAESSGSAAVSVSPSPTTSYRTVQAGAALPTTQEADESTPLLSSPRPL